MIANDDDAGVAKNAASGATRRRSNGAPVLDVPRPGMSRTSSACGVAFSLVLTACVGGFRTEMRPAPPQPSAEIPALPVAPGPVREGTGRVTLDVVQGPARVDEILEVKSETASGLGFDATGRLVTTHASVDNKKTRPVCTTPCAADLPYGSHRLRFTPVATPSYHESLGGDFDVVTGPAPSVARVRLAHVRSETRGVNLMWPGFGLLLVGLVGVGAGAYVAATADEKTNGYIALGAGSAITVLGTVLMTIDTELVNIETPGAMRQWTPQ